MAFVGIHIPLAGLVVLLVSDSYIDISLDEVLLMTFGLTFVAAIFCLMAIRQLLSPVHKAQKALKQYLLYKSRPNLPVHYTDEAGVLMRSVQQTIEHLDDLLREKQDLIALLSHDLRSPINTNSSLAELIRMKSDDPEIRQYCEHMLEQNHKQMSLLTTVLNLLKQDGQEQGELFVERVKLKPLIDEVMQQLSVDLTQKKIQAHLDVPEEVHISVQRDIFVQALVNIVHNAIKFSPRNKDIHIGIGQEQNFVEISVRDEGIGFENKDDIERIFDRFTSYRRKGTDGEPTTGMGMYLSRKIIRRHQGDIKVESEGLNKGATFRISVPA